MRKEPIIQRESTIQSYYPLNSVYVHELHVEFMFYPTAEQFCMHKNEIVHKSQHLILFCLSHFYFILAFICLKDYYFSIVSVIFLLRAEGLESHRLELVS